jgi:hypothetical protein
MLASIDSCLGDTGPRQGPVVFTAAVGIAADDRPTVASMCDVASMPEDQ